MKFDSQSMHGHYIGCCNLNMSILCWRWHYGEKCEQNDDRFQWFSTIINRIRVYSVHCETEWNEYDEYVAVSLKDVKLTHCHDTNELLLSTCSLHTNRLSVSERDDSIWYETKKLCTSSSVACVGHRQEGFSRLLTFNCVDGALQLFSIQNQLKIREIIERNRMES